MTTDPGPLQNALDIIAELKGLVRGQIDRLERAQASLERAVEMGLQHPLETAPADLPPPTEHRRRHRPGRPAKIDTDPELAAFIAARIDRLTFEEIADAVAEAFPPARRVRKSAIHAWWQRQQERRTPPTHPG